MSLERGADVNARDKYGMTLCNRRSEAAMGKSFVCFLVGTVRMGSLRTLLWCGFSGTYNNMHRSIIGSASPYHSLSMYCTVLSIHRVQGYFLA